MSAFWRNQTCNRSAATDRIRLVSGASRSAVWALLLLFPVFASFGSDQTNAANRLLEQMSNRWVNVPAVELRKAVEAGKADAQYYYFTVEWQAAVEALQRASAQWRNITNANPTTAAQAQPAAPAGGWAAAPEAETRQAAIAGDRQAQQVITRLETERAADRGRKSLDWLRKSADQGFAPAEYQLGMADLGLYGWRLVPPVPEEGLKLLRRAADQKFENAQHWLGDLLLQGDLPFSGDLLVPDVVQGLDYLRVSADQGCARAQFELAQQYASGNGEPRFSGESPASLLQQAAEGGWGEARFTLAERYRLGVGVSRDRAKAFFWYSLAAAQDSTVFGIAPAARQRDRLSPLLTAEDKQRLNHWSEPLRRWPE